MRRVITTSCRNLIATAVFMGAAFCCESANYYFHPVLGDDANSGNSPQSPFRTLERANRLKLEPGDRVLLAGGQKFVGQLNYERLAGRAAAPIVFSSYPTTHPADASPATIDAAGYVAGVRLKNCAQVGIENLRITANAGGLPSGQSPNATMRCGVLIEADQAGDFKGFSLSNLVVKDVFFEPPGFAHSQDEVRSANGTQNYGWGIRFLSTAADATLHDISITDCQIENVSHTGLKLTAPSNGLQNLKVQRIRIADTGGPGVQMSGVRNGHFSELDVNRSGSTNDSRNWGRGSGLWTWGSSEVIIEKSRFQNANGPGDSAGVHIDFNCRNVIVQHNLSANNAGGFCEILGNNYNCAYRYNVSINDGHRVKGVNGAFQEGKTFWLSGYTGDKSPRQGPFNTYFYNNTIYVREDIVAKFAVGPTAHGALIANNIFYIKGRSASVAGDQNRTDPGKATPIPGVIFQNNLFLRADNWPKASSLKDQSPLIGDPIFQNGGGLKTEDYIPRNMDLVRDRGISIPRLPEDENGLWTGLRVERDILSNPIVGQPDMGAIELPSPTTSRASR